MSANFSLEITPEWRKWTLNGLLHDQTKILEISYIHISLCPKDRESGNCRGCTKRETERHLFCREHNRAVNYYAVLKRNLPANRSLASEIDRSWWYDCSPIRDHRTRNDRISRRNKYAMILYDDEISLHCVEPWLNYSAHRSIENLCRIQCRRIYATVIVTDYQRTDFDARTDRFVTRGNVSNERSSESTNRSSRQPERLCA